MTLRELLTRMLDEGADLDQEAEVILINKAGDVVRELYVQDVTTRAYPDSHGMILLVSHSKQGAL